MASTSKRNIASGYGILLEVTYGHTIRATPAVRSEPWRRAGTLLSPLPALRHCLTVYSVSAALPAPASLTHQQRFTGRRALISPLPPPAPTFTACARPQQRRLCLPHTISSPPTVQERAVTQHAPPRHPSSSRIATPNTRAHRHPPQMGSTMEDVMRRRQKEAAEAYEAMWDNGRGSHHPDYDPEVGGGRCWGQQLAPSPGPMLLSAVCAVGCRSAARPTHHHHHHHHRPHLSPASPRSRAASHAAMPGLHTASCCRKHGSMPINVPIRAGARWPWRRQGLPRDRGAVQCNCQERHRQGGQLL